MILFDSPLESNDSMPLITGHCQVGVPPLCSLPPDRIISYLEKMINASPSWPSPLLASGGGMTLVAGGRLLSDSIKSWLETSWM